MCVALLIWVVLHSPVLKTSQYQTSGPPLKVNVKLSLCFNWAPRHESVLGKWSYSSTHSLTLALDGGEWLASCPGSFTPKERTPGTHWIGGWVGPRDVLDAVVKRKIPPSPPGIEPYNPNRKALSPALYLLNYPGPPLVNETLRAQIIRNFSGM
jgi:hypothetical protein